MNEERERRKQAFESIKWLFSGDIIGPPGGPPISRRRLLISGVYAAVAGVGMQAYEMATANNPEAANENAEDSDLYHFLKERIPYVDEQILAKISAAELEDQNQSYYELAGIMTAGLTYLYISSPYYRKAMENGSFQIMAIPLSMMVASYFKAKWWDPSGDFNPFDKRAQLEKDYALPRDSAFYIASALKDYHGHHQKAFYTIIPAFAVMITKDVVEKQCNNLAEELNGRAPGPWD